MPPESPGRDEAVAEIAGFLAAPTKLPLVVAGPDAAALVARASGRPLLLTDVRDLSKPEVMADAALAARSRAGCCASTGSSGSSPASGGAGARARRAPGAARSARADARRRARARRPHRAAGRGPDAELRRAPAAWSELTGAADTRDVGAKFRLSIEQIGEAAEVAAITARARNGNAPEPADLDRGARHASSSLLGELATRLTPRFRWEDLVLPDRQRELLGSISAYLRHRDRVLSEWGYERAVARTQGLKVLFAGESGTGKTMAAQVLAAELGLELFRVDLATVVSKYIGETEKNLDRIFEAAEGSNAILFFDEADALFGKRCEVSDAHDRYANIEVAYLLQQMEGYPGAVILATNFRQNIDDAFVRRLDFVIDFPFPEAEDRKLIWRLLLPEEAPLDAGRRPRVPRDPIQALRRRDPQLLAGGGVPGGRRGGSITMRHLIRAVAQEYGKQGRLTLQTDFEHFHELIGPGGRRSNFELRIEGKHGRVAAASRGGCAELSRIVRLNLSTPPEPTPQRRRRARGPGSRLALTRRPGRACTLAVSAALRSRPTAVGVTTGPGHGDAGAR